MFTTVIIGEKLPDQVTAAAVKEIMLRNKINKLRWNVEKSS